MASFAGYSRDYQEQVGMGEALSRFFSNYAEFSGRSNRGEYWWAVLGLFLINIALTVVDRVLIGAETFEPLSTIWSFIVMIPNFALSVRRLHDIDRSGWWVLGPVVLWLIAGFALSTAIASGSAMALPVLLVIVAIGFTLVLLVWACQPGDPRPNRFG